MRCWPNAREFLLIMANQVFFFLKMKRSMTIFAYKFGGANQINHMSISQNVFHEL